VVPIKKWQSLDLDEAVPKSIGTVFLRDLGASVPERQASKLSNA
jgi:hypothetical protein